MALLRPNKYIKLFVLLTAEEEDCLQNAYQNNDCDVQLKMMDCKENKGGWACLKRIPEVQHCARSH